MNTTKNNSYIPLNLLIVAFLFITFKCNSHKKAIISFNERFQALQNTYIKVKSLSVIRAELDYNNGCLLYTSPSPRDGLLSRMPSSA